MRALREQPRVTVVKALSVAVLFAVGVVAGALVDADHNGGQVRALEMRLGSTTLAEDPGRRAANGPRGRTSGRCGDEPCRGHVGDDAPSEPSTARHGRGRAPRATPREERKVTGT
jgi:hypothetical protein